MSGRSQVAGRAVCAVALALGSCWLAAPANGDELDGLAARYLQLAEARRIQIERLARYAETGKFPRNVGHLAAAPHFIDDRGRACAVAHLMLEAGLSGPVREVARECNHIRIARLEDGPVIDWILTSGLTQEECARIQPAYPPARRGQGRLRTGVWRRRRLHQEQAERERLQRHFAAVERELIEATHESLRIAMRRLLPRVRHRLRITAEVVDFAVVPARSRGDAAFAGAVTNLAAQPARVRVVFMNASARPTGQTGWIDLAAGETRPIGHDAPDDWAFVEWHADRRPGREPVVFRSTE